MASTCMSLPGACNLQLFARSAASTSTSSAFFRPSGASFLGQALETQLQSRCAHRRRAVVVRAEEVEVEETVSTEVREPVSTEVTEAKGLSRQTAEEVEEEEAISTVVTEAKGLSRETGGQWLSCTTRHVRIYAGVIDPESSLMDQSQLDKLTLMLDPDNEFEWPDEVTEKVYDKYRELIETYAGADLTEYTLRLIGSDIEHYIRKLVLAGELKYNLDCRVLNFSMGKPRIDPAELDDVEVEE
ncbi:hypothetical protein KC19_9G005700 [Ceratodon purpureus]|uniref:NAD(P)H-quinone oxidoreductase subunit M, chloroplastic n=1 Tax=Ceratodon purpureus TaxID=3225 RepID=A0A8T0GR62_CERPU|nr:hypothetical protein KC19_9G005700 [Ceratodon purpureus]